MYLISPVATSKSNCATPPTVKEQRGREKERKRERRRVEEWRCKLKKEKLKKDGIGGRQNIITQRRGGGGGEREGDLRPGFLN